MKTYLGDGCFAELERGMIKLTTEDGRSATNTIYLEPEVYAALVRFVDSVPAAHSTECLGCDEEIRSGDERRGSFHAWCVDRESKAKS